MLLGSLEELEHFRILRAILITMCPTITRHTDSECALLAMPDVVLDMLRLDPFTAVDTRAVYPIRCRKLEVLGIPQFLILVRQEILDVLQRDMVWCAAFRWHVSRIRQGKNKESL